MTELYTTGSYDSVKISHIVMANTFKDIRAVDAITCDVNDIEQAVIVKATGSLTFTSEPSL